MKKQTKGAIAAAAAGALLLGGAGSYAVWSDSADVDVAGPVNSGKLDLSDCVSTGIGGGWNSLNPPVTPITSISAYHIVPTESIGYTCEVTVGAVGDRLAATFTANAASITDSAAPANLELLTALGTPTVSILNAADEPITAITAADNNSKVRVLVRLDFSNVSDLVAQTQVVNLAAVTLTLTQTALATAP